MTEKDFDKPGTLMQRTRALLKQADVVEVHIATRLPFYWLRNFQAGANNNPSVNRVQCLYEHLTGKEMDLE